MIYLSTFVVTEMMKLKSKSIQQSKNILEKDDLECRNIEKHNRRSLLAKRKLVGSVGEVNETFPTKQSKAIQSKKVKKNNTIASKFRVANVVTNSLPVKTASTISGNEHLATESESEIISVTASEKKLRAKKPIKLPRKILKLSPDESEDKFQVHLSDWTPMMTDTGEILAAVRVEMDESGLSDDDDEQPEAIFEKWMRKMERGTENKNSAVTYPPAFSMEDDSIARQNMPLYENPMPEDIDHGSGENDRQTHPRFVYRIDQCFPEKGDDVSLTKSKLRFIIETLKSQHNRVQALQKSCRELSRSNATLRDILRIMPSNSDDEMMETDGQAPAYLIVGLHPSGSTSHPSYRFTLTDCSPAAITKTIV